MHSALGKRILSVSYDKTLLRTRHMILQNAGFIVTSALGFTEGLRMCGKGPFDLIIMGHSIPLADKTELVKCFKQQPDCPIILSIRRHGASPLPEADYSVDSFEGPEVLLAAVHAALDRENSR